MLKPVLRTQGRVIPRWHELPNQIRAVGRALYFSGVFRLWGEIFGDEVMAAALIDRLVHHCHITNIRSNSYRMRHHTELHHALGTARSADTPPRSRSRTKEAQATRRLAPPPPRVCNLGR